MKLSLLLLGSIEVDAGRRRRFKSNKNCFDLDNGNYDGYIGKQSKTFNGHECQPWHDTRPHRPSDEIKRRVLGAGVKYNNNYCRNPDNDPNGPWCYTMNTKERYDYCDIPACKKQPPKYDEKRIRDVNCVDDKGTNYKGTANHVVKGGNTYKCQSWSAVSPHRSMFLINEKHNYCRNPNNDPNGPWCYILGHHTMSRASCNIPPCTERAGAQCGKPVIQPVFTKAKHPTVIKDRRRRSAKFDDLPFFDFEYDYEDNLAADLTGKRKQFIKDVPPTTKQVRIVGGEEVKPNSVPWQISLRYKQDRMAFCGGSIVAPNRIVTAAHCVMDEPMYRHDHEYHECYTSSLLEVYAGTHTKSGLSQQDIHKQARDVRAFCMHPEWNEDQIYADAAVLILKNKFNFDAYVSPICLPQTDAPLLRSDVMCQISGFGRTQGTADDNKLNQQVLPVVENRKCNRWLSNAVPDKTQLCAGFEKGGFDTCQGDSGGPFACKHNGVWTLDGITSWGYGCGDARSPGVYTRVSHGKILSWIQNMM